MFLPVGTTPPSFSLPAVVHQRLITPHTFLGIPQLWVFVNHLTATQTRDISLRLRPLFPKITQLALVNFVDLQIVPRLLRGIAEGMINGVYQQALKELPAGYAPEDYLIVVPDWAGQLFAQYQIPAVNQHPALMWLNPAGQITATYQGANPAEVALTWLQTNPNG